MERQEIFKPIKGFEDYMISNLGRIWSHKTNNFRSPVNNGKGYFTVDLYKNGKHFTKKVHRLVAQAFIENPEGYTEINHKNEQKTDNRAENLEWCSRQYNIEYSKSKSYVLYGPNDERCEIYNLAKFAKDNGLRKQSLYNVIKGKINSFLGYTKEPGINYTIRRKGEFRLMSPEKETFTFQSQQNAANYLGSFEQNIHALLKGKQKSVKGWKLYPLDGIFAFT